MNVYTKQAELLKLLGHPARLKVLEVLRDGEQCVCHLEAVLGLRQAYISQQLMVLRRAGLVVDRKDGLHVYYGIGDASVYAITDVARGLIERQAQREGQSLNFALAAKGKTHPCDCPKCVQKVSEANTRE